MDVWPRRVRPSEPAMCWCDVVCVASFASMLFLAFARRTIDRQLDVFDLLFYFALNKSCPPRRTRAPQTRQDKSQKVIPQLPNSLILPDQSKNPQSFDAGRKNSGAYLL